MAATCSNRYPTSDLGQGLVQTLGTVPVRGQSPCLAHVDDKVVNAKRLAPLGLDDERIDRTLCVGRGRRRVGQIRGVNEYR